MSLFLFFYIFLIFSFRLGIFCLFFVLFRFFVLLFVKFVHFILYFNFFFPFSEFCFLFRFFLILFFSFSFLFSFLVLFHFFVLLFVNLLYFILHFNFFFQLFELEARREKEMPWVVTKMQKHIRGFVDRKKFNRKLALTKIIRLFRWAQVKEKGEKKRRNSKRK